MPRKELIRDNTYRITIRPTTDFAKGDVMFTRVDGYDYRGQFRTRDVGAPGGMQFIIGKLARDVERVGKERAKTEIHAVNLFKGDFNIENGSLIPTTSRGRLEHKDIVDRWGDLHYVGGDYFVPEKEWEKFERLRYFEGFEVSVLSMLPKEIDEGRRAGIPESILGKMARGVGLTVREKNVIIKHGKVYVEGYFKAGRKVRPQLRDLPR